MKKALLITGMTIAATFATATAFAKCKIAPENIEQVAAGIRWQNEYGEEDNTAIVRSEWKASVSKGKRTTYAADYEAFLRTDHTEAFQVLPVPLFMVQMEKERDAIYICTHLDYENERKSLTVVYFLRNRRIHPITPMPLPISQLGKLIWGPIENTPLIVTKLPLSVLARAQTLIVHAFSDLTRIGVDRVRITESQIELYSGGDPAQFKTYILKKVIPLKEK